MTEYLTLTDATAMDFAALASRELNRSVDERTASRLLELLTQLHDPASETVNSVPTVRLRTQIGHTRYVINIKRALLVAAATLLDTHGVGGAANAALMLSGFGTKAIAKLNQKTGQLCNYVSIARDQIIEPFEPVQLAELTRTKPCRFPAHACCHMAAGQCDITPEAVQRNIEGMVHQRVLVIDKEGNLIREM